MSNDHSRPAFIGREPKKAGPGGPASNAAIDPLLLGSREVRHEGMILVDRADLGGAAG